MIKKRVPSASDNGKLIAYLEAMIAGGQFAAGDRLPPLRKLAEEFELTPSCAHRAVRLLCERGLLELRHGSGTFVREGRASGGGGGGVISVVIWDRTLVQSYCAYALQGMQEAASATAWRLKLFFAPYEQMARLPELARDIWDCEVAAFLGCYDMFDLESLEFMRPCVGLEMHNMVGGVFSTISIDPFSAAEQAARHFRRNGVTHVQVVSQPMPVHRVRAEVFRQCWSAGGGTSELIERASSAGGAPFCIDPDGACLFTGGSDFNFAARTLREREGRVLAENPNMIGIDGKSLLFPDFEPSNTLSIDWRRAGGDVLEECVRRASCPGSAARRISIHPRLMMYDAGSRGGESKTSAVQVTV